MPISNKSGARTKSGKKENVFCGWEFVISSILFFFVQTPLLPTSTPFQLARLSETQLYKLGYFHNRLVSIGRIASVAKKHCRLHDVYNHGTSFPWQRHKESISTPESKRKKFSSWFFPLLKKWKTLRMHLQFPTKILI